MKWTRVCFAMRKFQKSKKSHEELPKMHKMIEELPKMHKIP
jgi:hypothetical protein